MPKYYKKLLKSIENLGQTVPDILKESYQDTMDAFLNRFLRRIKSWKTNIFTGIILNSIFALIGLPLLISGIVLILTTPLLLLSIILMSVGFALALIATGIFLLTNNYISYYQLGKNTGRLEERSKEMLQKFPEFEKKINVLLKSKGIFTPKNKNKYITKDAYKTFKEKDPTDQQINMFRLEASTIFKNATDTSELGELNYSDKGTYPDSTTDSTTDSAEESNTQQCYSPQQTNTPPNVEVITNIERIVTSNIPPGNRDPNSSDSNGSIENTDLNHLIK